jgi:hypothetical protein
MAEVRIASPAPTYIAMRLQHTKLAAANLSTDDPARVTAKNALRSIKWIRKVMHVFKGEHCRGAKGMASRKLWHAFDKWFCQRSRQ